MHILIKALLSLNSLLLVFILTFSGNVLADKESGVCKAPNPTSVDSVYNCITQSSTNGINMFAQIDRMDCARIRGFYGSVLRASWADPDLIKNPPSCQVFAEIVKELTGKPAFWQGCMNYANTEPHLSSCIEGYLKLAGQANQASIGQCQTTLLFYEAAVRGASEPSKSKQGLLPENYQKPSCDMVNSALNKLDIELAGAECLGFGEVDAALHVKECLRTDFLSKRYRNGLECNQMRRFYQTKVTRTYGSLPKGFALLRCSVFDKVSAELVAEVKAIEAQKQQALTAPSNNPQPRTNEASERRGRRNQKKRTPNTGL